MLWFFVLVSCVVVCQGKSSGKEGFDKEEKQVMLDLHNYFRAKVAMGKQIGQPQAGNMMAVTWDDVLEQKAQSWANKCIFKHDESSARSVPNYRWVGQNLASGHTLSSAAKAWYEEVTNDKFVYDGQTCLGVCGHYTQMVWWHSWKLGCALKVCPNNVYIMCNYAPGGNIVGTSIYLDSAPCSKCPHGFGFCMHNALCATEEQCSNSESECKCTITECAGHGDVDLKSCKCPCEGDCDGKMANVKTENPDSLKTNVYSMNNYLNCQDAVGMCELQSCTTDVEWAKRNCNKHCKFCDPTYETKFTASSAIGDRSYAVQFYRTFLTSLFLLIFSIYIF